MQKNLERMDSEQTKQWDAIEECRRYQNKILYGVALSLLGILGQFVLLFLRRPGG